jgi:hypothetical protein
MAYRMPSLDGGGLIVPLGRLLFGLVACAAAAVGCGAGVETPGGQVLFADGLQVPGQQAGIFIPYATVRHTKPLAGCGAMSASVGHPAGDPSPIQIMADAPDGIYWINQQPHMPAIHLRARVLGITPDPTPHANFEWTVRIRYQAPPTLDGAVRSINYDLPPHCVVGGNYTPDFGGVIRGGDLSVVVRVRVRGKVYRKDLDGLRILGENPSRADIHDMLPHDVLRRIARLESNDRQFEPNGLPMWSADGKGGVGIMQLTNPPPSDDQVWNWRLNVAGGAALFHKEVAPSSEYPEQLRASMGLRAMAGQYNALRAKNHLKPLQLFLPEFTWGDFGEHLGQVDLNAIRCYNGLAGSDGFGNPLQEFRVATDVVNGQRILRVVNIDEKKLTGQLVWERVPCQDRPAVGDPNYVNDVLAESPGSGHAVVAQKPRPARRRRQRA